MLDRLQAKFSLQLRSDAAARPNAPRRRRRSPTKSAISRPAPGWRSCCAATASCCGRKSRWASRSSLRDRHRARSETRTTLADRLGVGTARRAKSAPALFESLNVEIDGYTLAEALDAIGPRIKMPLYWDHAALAEHKIDPATMQGRTCRAREPTTSAILDRVLAQARLAGKLRVDEAGTAVLVDHEMNLRGTDYSKLVQFVAPAARNT